MPFNKTEVDIRTDYSWRRSTRRGSSQGVKSPKHLMLDPDNCILCRACEDVCPWNCIYMLSTGIVTDAAEQVVGEEVDVASAIFVVDDNRLHALFGVRGSLPNGHLVLRAAARRFGRQAHDGRGSRLAGGGGGRVDGGLALKQPKAVARRERVKLKPPSPSDVGDRIRDTEVWKSIFRPGSIFRRGYKDTSRDRALATMNNVLYHLHPVKVKRHGLKLTYTFCLGGLSFFLFILLTITGIFLMFFYRPVADLGGSVGYTDMQAIRTSVFFGDLVRNLHRWGAHLMVFSVSLHMARVFYTGSYKPPREFNWVVGVILLFLTLGLSFTGYLLPWDQLAIWAVTVGTSLAGYSPFIAKQANFLLLGGVVVGPDTLLRWYVLHVLALPFVLVIFLAVHFWRIRKDGGISGPL